MFADSPFAHPVSSYERPVPLVLSDPCSDPTVTVKINREWIPYVLGALKQLVLQSTWNTDDPDALDLVQQRAMLLLSCVGTALDEPNCEPGCDSYVPSRDFITWAPQNPYTEPDLVPPHYVFPPWVVLGSEVPFTGLQAGDVVTTLLRAPVDTVLAGGFPRFRVKVNGPGTVELSLLRFPTASIALISVDDNPASLRWTDLNVGLEAAIGTPIPVEVVPVQVSGEGEHHIDVTIIPSVGATPPYINFGGGIRKIALCGFGQTPQPDSGLRFIPEWEDDDLNLHCNMRIHQGKLQVTNGCDCDGSPIWADVCSDGSTLSMQGTVSQDSGTPPDPGGTECFDRVLAAGASWVVPFGLKNGDVVTVSNRQGSWSSDGIRWTCTDGTPFALGQCSGSRYHDGADPSSSLYHGQLMLMVQGQMLSLTDGPITLSGITGQAQATVAGNFSAQAFAGGNVSFNICITNGSTPPTGDWCQYLDFRLSDYGFTAEPGSYVPGVGFVTSYAIGNQAVAAVAPSSVLTGFRYTDVEFVFNYTLGTFSPAGAAWELIVAPDADQSVASGDATSGDNQTYAWSGDTTSPTQISLYLRSAHNHEDGAATITGVTLKGKGTNPFGTSNC